MVMDSDFLTVKTQSQSCEDDTIDLSESCIYLHVTTIDTSSIQKFTKACSSVVFIILTFYECNNIKKGTTRQCLKWRKKKKKEAITLRLNHR